MLGTPKAAQRCGVSISKVSARNSVITYNMDQPSTAVITSKSDLLQLDDADRIAHPPSAVCPHDNTTDIDFQHIRMTCESDATAEINLRYEIFKEHLKLNIGQILTRLAWVTVCPIYMLPQSTLAPLMPSVLALFFLLI